MMLLETLQVLMEGCRRNIIAGNGDRHFPHLVVTVFTFPISYTIFSHVKNLVKSICCKLDYLSGSYTAIHSSGYDITNPFPCCYRSQN